MPKYVGTIEKDILGNDRIVVRKERAAEDYIGEIGGAAVVGAVNLIGAAFEYQKYANDMMYANRLDFAIKAAEDGHYNAALNIINYLEGKIPEDIRTEATQEIVAILDQRVASGQALFADRGKYTGWNLFFGVRNSTTLSFLALLVCLVPFLGTLVSVLAFKQVWMVRASGWYKPRYGVSIAAFLMSLPLTILSISPLLEKLGIRY